MPIFRLTAAVGLLTLLYACAAPNSATKPDAAMAKDASCLTATGSRLSTGVGCSAYGRSYSSSDIDRTGTATVGGSLRLLDPALTVH